MASQTGLSRLFTGFFRFHYWLGARTIRKWRHFSRWFGRVSAPARRTLRYYWTRRIKWPVHRFARKQRILRRQTLVALKFLWRQTKEKPSSAIPTLFRLCGGAVRHYWDELTSLGRFLGPVAAGAVLVLTVVAWTGAPYRLNLAYQGEELGTVSNAAVYDAGAALARDRVINEDDSFSVDTVPTYTITMQGWKTPLSEEQVCDGILRTAGDSIAEACGLYVNGKFVGAMETTAAVDSLLASYKEGYGDPDDPDQRVDFVQTVETTEGLYPISTIRDKTAMNQKLTSKTAEEQHYTVAEGDTLSTIAQQFDLTTAQLRQMNPEYTSSDDLRAGDRLTVNVAASYLQVKVVKTVKYSETIDYKTKTVYRDDKPVGYNQTTTAGQEGQRDIVAEDTYVDGLKTGRKIIKKTVSKEAVTKVVEVGTRKQDPSMTGPGDGVTHGTMTWPVPICHNMSRGYYRGHYAIDICNGPIKVLGKPAVAADGGTVIQAAYGWNGGFGNVVKIQHDNGLVTLYAHLQSVKVVAGQKISRGQTIGLIGNTGNSQGPHLHFEVIKNGVRVDPLDYVEP